MNHIVYLFWKKKLTWQGYSPPPHDTQLQCITFFILVGQAEAKQERIAIKTNADKINLTVGFLFVFHLLMIASNWALDVGNRVPYIFCLVWIFFVPLVNLAGILRSQSCRFIAHETYYLPRNLEKVNYTFANT